MTKPCTGCGAPIFDHEAARGMTCKACEYKAFTASRLHKRTPATESVYGVYTDRIVAAGLRKAVFTIDDIDTSGLSRREMLVALSNACVRRQIRRVRKAKRATGKWKYLPAAYRLLRRHKPRQRGRRQWLAKAMART